ncbi:MAG TPA: YraN family protein [Castellaniella sp.]|nr:YraN family protein [Castellaniella sp.]
MHDAPDPAETTRPQDAYERARHAQAQALARRRKRPSRPRKRPQSEAWQGSPSQRQGRSAEMRAGRYLQAQGLQLLAHSLNCRAGEIDWVALDGDVMVFIEVRARAQTSFGGAAASVNRRKQQRLLKAARFFLPSLSRRHLAGQMPPCRFDVVCLERGSIHWLRNAFTE